jgi:hypothetical protein
MRNRNRGRIWTFGGNRWGKKESEMTNFPDRNMDHSGFPRDDYRIGPAGNSPMWIIVVIAVVAVLGLMFYFGSASTGRIHPEQSAIEQQTQPVAPAPTPAKPTAPKQ